MNILTFDIEEWFHILDHDATRDESQWGKYEKRLDQNMERIFRILEERHLQGTFFCLGWVARNYPQVIRQIVERGHELATHSDLHQLAYEQTPRQFREDLKQSIESLEDTAGVKIRAYRAPGFSLTAENSWVFEELIAAGIEVDCSVFPAGRAHGGFAGFGEETPVVVKTDSGSLREFPINTHRLLGRSLIFSGGGYFRLLPASMIHRFTRDSDYVMTYFHPRDFDADQPLIENLSLPRRFKAYVGLKRAQSKFEQWLDAFRFVSLGQAEQQVDWDSVAVVDMSGQHREAVAAGGNRH